MSALRQGEARTQDRPRFPLAVLWCKAHEVYFTLYPLGFSPYGREPLALLTPSGNSVARERAQPYQGTYFQTALDAVDQPLWPDEGSEGCPLVSPGARYRQPSEQWIECLTLDRNRLSRARLAVRGTSRIPAPATLAPSQDHHPTIEAGSVIGSLRSREALVRALRSDLSS